MKTLFLFILRWLGILAELVLAIGVVFRLFGAGGQGAFIQLISDAASLLVSPFEGIFPALTFGAKYVLDTPALVAMFIYALAYGILRRLVVSLLAVFEDRPESASLKNHNIDKSDIRQGRGKG